MHNINEYKWVDLYNIIYFYISIFSYNSKCNLQYSLIIV